MQMVRRTHSWLPHLLTIVEWNVVQTPQRIISEVQTLIHDSKCSLITVYTIQNRSKIWRTVTWSSQHTTSPIIQVYNCDIIQCVTGSMFNHTIDCINQSLHQSCNIPVHTGAHGTSWVHWGNSPYSGQPGWSTTFWCSSLLLDGWK